MSTFSAPAKIILFGEHAVVYGQPAIAIPFSSLRATAVVQPNTGQGLLIVAKDLQQTIHVEEADNVLAYTARTILPCCKIVVSFTTSSATRPVNGRFRWAAWVQ